MDSQDEKPVPGTLLDTDEISSHHHQHGHNHTPPSLVEVRLDLLKNRINLISSSFIFILMVHFDIRLYLN